MNTIIFIGGAGAGAIITTCLFLLLINKLLARRSKSDETFVDYNERNLTELKRRDEIGERQEDAPGKIAAWCEHNWHGRGES